MHWPGVPHTHIYELGCVVNHSLELNRVKELPVQVAVRICRRWLHTDMAAINAPSHLIKSCRPCQACEAGSHSHQLLLCGMVDGLGKEGGYLATGGVDGTVDRGSRHVECPGDDTVGRSTGQPKQEHQAGDFQIPAVVCFSPYGVHQGIERSPGQSEIHPQVTLAIKKLPY